MAMTFHPDRNQGDVNKADTFKSATEAYSILGDHKKRTEYDKVSHGYYSNSSGEHRYTRTTPKPPPPNYRRVYAPRAPPGFKTFDHQRHFDMHYGDGQMKEEIERVQKRAMQAGERTEYQSPLGPGFSFDHFEKTADGNPFARGKQGPTAATTNGESGTTTKVEYQEAFFGGEWGGRKGGESNATKYYHKVYVREKMEERRQSRPTREAREKMKSDSKKYNGCVIS